MKPIWDQATAKHLGPPPLEVAAALARLGAQHATHIHAEADVPAAGDGGTMWRVLWLAGGHLGILDASSDMTDWGGHSYPGVNPPKVSACVRPLADIRRVTYTQDALHRSFSEGEYSLSGTVRVHFDDHDDEVVLGDREWKYFDQESADAFGTAIVEKWTAKDPIAG